MKKCKRTPIPHMHEKLILDILCFLPAKSIIRCSCVCKEWANLIYQPSFPHVYFSRGQAPLQLVLKIDYANIVVAQFDEALYTASYPSNYSIRKKSIFDINIRRIFLIYSDFVICQATGWILTTWYGSGSDPQFKCQYHMYNPITGQHMVVQNAIWNNDVVCKPGALIFVLKTNQLKLLGYYWNKQAGGPVEAYIQTIGTNTWRSLGELPYSYSLVHPIPVSPVSLNGLCHWFNRNCEVIHSFDPDKEIFDQAIQTPPLGYYPAMLGSLDGCLCLSLTKSGECEIWVMHEYGVQDSWTKKFVISDIAQYLTLRPLACLKNGEILMLKEGIHGKTIRYDWEKDACMICFDRSSSKYRHVGIRKSWKKN